MELKEVAKAWIEMWDIELEDPARNMYGWVDDFEYEAVYENPDLAIDLVLEVLNHAPTDKTKEVLAAGPLEQVLANHGSKIIERVESLAGSNPDFSSLLGGVWQNSMSPEIWQRVQRVWNRSGWDGNLVPQQNAIHDITPDICL